MNQSDPAVVMTVDRRRHPSERMIDLARSSTTPGATTSRAPARRRDVQTPAAATIPDDERYELWCDIQRSARYHRSREAFFQWYASSFTFLTLLAGSGVVATLLADAAIGVSIALGVAVAAMQAIELAFQISHKARHHSALASEFLALDQILTRMPSISHDTLRDLRAEILSIEAREPPVKRYLDLICHNQVAVMIGSDDIAPLTWWQRRFAHWLSGDGALQQARPQA